MRRSSDYGWVFGLVVFIVVAFGAVSWGKNIYEVTQCDFEAPYKCEVLRIIGVPAFPVGVVVGFMDLGE